MTEQQFLERITMNPNVMVGKPVIKGTWLTVEYILGLFRSWCQLWGDSERI
jgi:uncharacterized protein (DUF433 family)